MDSHSRSWTFQTFTMKLILLSGPRPEVWQINHFDFQDFVPGHELSQRDLSICRFVLIYILRFVDFRILGLFLALKVIVGFSGFFLPCEPEQSFSNYFIQTRFHFLCEIQL